MTNDNLLSIFCKIQNVQNFKVIFVHAVLIVHYMFSDLTHSVGMETARTLNKRKVARLSPDLARGISEFFLCTSVKGAKVIVYQPWL